MIPSIPKSLGRLVSAFLACALSPLGLSANNAPLSAGAGQPVAAQAGAGSGVGSGYSEGLSFGAGFNSLNDQRFYILQSVAFQTDRWAPDLQDPERAVAALASVLESQEARDNPTSPHIIAAQVLAEALADPRRIWDWAPTFQKVHPDLGLEVARNLWIAASGFQEAASGKPEVQQVLRSLARRGAEVAKPHPRGADDGGLGVFLEELFSGGQRAEEGADEPMGKFGARSPAAGGAVLPERFGPAGGIEARGRGAAPRDGWVLQVRAGFGALRDAPSGTLRPVLPHPSSKRYADALAGLAVRMRVPEARRGEVSAAVRGILSQSDFRGEDFQAVVARVLPEADPAQVARLTRRLSGSQADTLWEKSIRLPRDGLHNVTEIWSEGLGTLRQEALGAWQAVLREIVTHPRRLSALNNAGRRGLSKEVVPAPGVGPLLQTDTGDVRFAAARWALEPLVSIHRTAVWGLRVGMATTTRTLLPLPN